MIWNIIDRRERLCGFKCSLSLGLVIALVGGLAACEKYDPIEGDPERALLVEADILYDGKPLRLAMRTDCQVPKAYMSSVPIQAYPDVVAASLPDGSVIAFSGMTYICRAARMEAGRQIQALPGGRRATDTDTILKGARALPPLTATWFSAKVRPEIFDEYLTPTPTAGRYRPVAFRYRQVTPSIEEPTPQRVLEETLPAWRAMGPNERRGARYCGGKVESFPLTGFASKAGLLSAGRGFAAYSYDNNPHGRRFFPDIGPEGSFEETGGIERPGATAAAVQLQERRARRERLKTFVRGPNGWSAESIQVIRNYRFGFGESPPRNVEIDGVTVPVGRLFVVLQEKNFVAGIGFGCLRWPI
ncbi:MAG: hypothetical protein B7Z44_04490 [Caulobacter sp. 12-67-6]|nr:MAG: hypothetical protein B7Z44_04490 [Caulobacter sp. 12-67-6]OYX68194.1 MAG: hypothetical protein B7Y81_17480 [Caulobacter sp. 32-67-35]OYX94982.1 MAG: hypothetical protein B7Y78_05820 [Caulobacter sp. 35-67-4]